MENQQKNTIKKFFKVIGIIVLVVVSLVVALLAYFWLDSYLAEKEQEKVKMTISYDTEKCTDRKQPLYITIANDSKKVIKNTSFDIEITRKGYSNDLADYSDYKTDMIIEPSYVSSGCWSYGLKPENKNYNNPNDLEFEINHKRVTFEE